MTVLSPIAPVMFKCEPPTELRELQGWLIWRYEQGEGEEKPRKVPSYVSGGRRYGKQGSPEDRAKLTTFAAARDAAARQGFDGVGLAMFPEWGISGLDFDFCVGPDGSLPQEITDIVSDGYCEYSPSGKGVRAFVRGDLGDFKSFAGPDFAYGMEVFSSKGFLTVSGNPLPFVEALGLQDTIAPAGERVHALCAQRFGANRDRIRSASEDGALDPYKPPHGVSDEEIEAYLSDLDPSMSRDHWIKVGMALHHETDGGGFDLWDNWSSDGVQYPGTEALQQQWVSLARRDTRKEPVTFATVKAMSNKAREERGEPSRALKTLADLSVSIVDWPEPLDPWRRHDPPALPRGVLPDVIERFARVQGEQMGVDPGGLAQSALTVCAAAIPDSIQLQVKAHDPGWRQSARLWTALVGLPSAKKSPILRAAIQPLRKIDAEARKRYAKERAAYEKLSAEDQRSEPKPVLIQCLVEDTTVEALALVAAHNVEGVLAHRDELGGWFGGLEKYSGSKGSGLDRSVYLQAYDGGAYSINRVGRGAIFIDNLSVNLLGGIQPDTLRRATKDTPDDGLVQRLTPIVLARALIGKDEPAPDVTSEYEQLVRRVTGLRDYPFHPETLTFDAGAQEVRRRLEMRHHDLACMETVNRKLASHIGKYDGMFARLCVVFHCVENAGADDLPPSIGTDTATRVAAYLADFLMPHALAFYTSVLGLADHDDLLLDVAGYILAHKKSKLAERDFQRGSTAMKSLAREQIKRLMEALEALGWGESAGNAKPNAPLKWLVNPKVHTVFAEKALEEKARRAEIREVIGGLYEVGV